MRGHDLPTIIKLLEVHGGVSHHRTLPPKEARRILILFKQLLPKELTAME
jgi:hypothetical protein